MDRTKAPGARVGEILGVVAVLALVAALHVPPAGGAPLLLARAHLGASAVEPLSRPPPGAGAPPYTGASASDGAHHVSRSSGPPDDESPSSPPDGRADQTQAPPDRPPDPPRRSGVPPDGSPDPTDEVPGRPDGPDVVPVPPDGAGVPAPGARYAWPLLPVPAIAARFQAPPHPYGRGHRGVDLVGTAGQPVLAARAGTVVFAGPVGARSVLSVDHDDGLRTTYEPVRPTVRAGAVVRAGDVLGLLEPGHPGCTAAACLHWGVRRGPQEYLDPLVLLRPPEVRLLPVPDPWPAGIMAARGPPPPVATSGQPTASSSSLPRRRPTSRVCS